MSARKIIGTAWLIAATALSGYFWATYSGLYRMAAEWQLAQFGYYNEKYTVLGPWLLLCLPGALLAGRTLRQSPPAAPADPRRMAKGLVLFGAAALAVSAIAGGLGYQRIHAAFTSADLELVTGAEPEPPADLVTLTAIARTELTTVFAETIAGRRSEFRFVPLVAPAWRAGQPIRFILKTNQNAWLPREGISAGHGVEMLERSNRPFRIVTQPSVLKHHALPGIIGAAYEKAQVPLDPAIAVVEQSPGEVLAPYWMTAMLAGLLGIVMLLAGGMVAFRTRKA